MVAHCVKEIFRYPTTVPASRGVCHVRLLSFNPISLALRDPFPLVNIRANGLDKPLIGAGSPLTFTKPGILVAA
jgi:hypothetical protein